ncbi:uncharacterized protein [Lolium perenne]|uniref:uncharacterized protein n=1 Tax=Lolium perenne TaxID=4522 RepID=UPI0021F695D6|nr:uncharacterized protein LOC127334330 [Lolium perenne]
MVLLALLKELHSAHELYRKSYQLSQQVTKEDYPPSRLEEKRLLKRHEELDWSFRPDYCEIADLEDYQRLVPRNYGGYEYVKWDEYHTDFHSYEIEQEYIKYCEKMSKELKWMEAYVPNKSPSLKWGRIVTRGTYQAIKIATGFSKITPDLAFSGFYEWLDSMTFDVCYCNEFDGVYYEIWQRYTNEKKFGDALDEVYKLNRFPLRQDIMRCALEDDKFCSDFEEEFFACTTCLKEFTEDKANVTEEKARELITEALRKEKPKFYEEYCRKKINIARAIGLVSS